MFKNSICIYLKMVENLLSNYLYRLVNIVF